MIYHFNLSFLGCLLDMTSILIFIFYIMHILDININNLEKTFFVTFYAIGLLHPLGTSMILLYFLSKTIKNSLIKEIKNKRYVKLIFNNRSALFP